MLSWLEIPLALLSFCFNKATKLIIGNLYRFYLAFNRQRATQWQVLSAETLEKPLSLPVLMTKAPRWNTHAIIGTLGPVHVNRSVAIDLQSCNFSSQSWIAIFYSSNYQSVASIESRNRHQGEWATLQLEPGQYTIGLRYYNWSEQVKLPAVKVDEREVVSPQVISPDVNRFYDSLRKRNWFYLWLHTYIFTLLKLKDWFPEAFVKKEYLPVGATDTKFLYGCLQKAEKLQIALNSSTLKHYELYLTIYDRSSFPLTWCQIDREKLTTEPVEENGSYLLRIRRKDSVSDSSLQCDKSRNELSIEIAVLSEV